MFNIHPLTTEDIQMEETREKIELFRDYYFVCFRGFDQDPYSPTHLEPLNMYIIVFRDGILSVCISRLLCDPKKYCSLEQTLVPLQADSPPAECSAAN